MTSCQAAGGRGLLGPVRRRHRQPEHVLRNKLELTEKFKPWLWIRGEARYDWSQFTHPFSDGTRSSQLTLLVATIVLF